MGHPLLRQPAQAIEPGEIGSEKLGRLIDDMVDTLQDYSGIGLAAPQIAEPVRLAIIEIPDESARYDNLESVPLMVFINPVIEIIDPATHGYWEGCLSVPGLRGFVERPQHVKISYTSVQGEALELEVQGFAATVFQHELDHLDGKLFIDRITDTRLLAFEAEYERYLLPMEAIHDSEGVRH
jgi:peptide deformylase